MYFSAIFFNMKSTAPLNANRLFFWMLMIGLCVIAWSFTDGKASCSKYKTGTFLYKFNRNGQSANYVCIRKGNVQTEKDRATGKTTTLNIKWLGDCTFEMRFAAKSERLSKEELEIAKKLVLTVTILGGTDDYYIFNSVSNLYKYNLTDTMWIQR